MGNDMETGFPLGCFWDIHIYLRALGLICWLSVKNDGRTTGWKLYLGLMVSGIENRKKMEVTV